MKNTSFFKVIPELIQRNGKTTFMIKNIPNQITKKALMRMIDTKFRGSYDFLYLPIDSKSRLNVSYAFINFINLKAALDFYYSYHGMKWSKRYKSKKICEVYYGRI